MGQCSNVQKSLYCCLLLIPSESRKLQICLTGYMTEVQTWVDDKGVLTNAIDYHTAIDLSANSNPVPILQQKMTIMRSSGEVSVKYLSLARCRLSRVPTVFQFRDSQGRDLAQTVEYMTFFGNVFQDISSPGEQYDVSMNATQARERIIGVGYQRNSNAVWSTGFNKIDFPRLKELDLRACSIQVLSGHIFEGMPNLEALYIGENEIVYIDANAFQGLSNLIHLDMSKNEAYDSIGNFKMMTVETFYVFEPLVNLASLDFSFTKLSSRHTTMFQILGPKVSRLSICHSGLTALEDDFFNRTSLRILDVSGNNGILSNNNVLRGLESKLHVLYAQDVGLRTMELVNGFDKLEILSLTMNEIGAVSAEVARTLKSLQVLELDKNRISSWFGQIYSLMPNLQLLSFRDNNVNVISEEMIEDIAKINYVAMSGNFIVCNCHTRDFFDLALRNEQMYETHKLKEKTELPRQHPIMSYHRGFIDINKVITNRKEVFVNCTKEAPCYDDLHEDVEGNFLLLDFHPTNYMCLQVPESKSIEFSEVPGCNRSSRDIDYDKTIEDGRTRVFVSLIFFPLLLIIMAIGFIFRRNLRYFCITMKNSALLSAINKDEVLDETAIFHYDVFVSYCNEDRNWVLDHLLPHLESDCSISACLHERDFQVGHSILENIVSCMDRSRSIMLIMSQRFLLSQWCQFEMHLAQHRLLETRREDLTLVLLEEIPRRLRPNTLHYLMLTKTYIVWPNDEAERTLFWKRLKKTLVTMKLKQTSAAEASSIA